MKPKNIRITILVVTILATLFGQTDVAKSQVVTDGLLSYWTFDTADVTGQTAKDVWGGRDGTIIGNTHSTAGRIGDALTFDGDGDYVDFDPSGLPEGNAPRTMSVWVKPEGAGVRPALEWGANANTQRCAILILANQTIKFCGQNADVTSNGSVANSEWHYVTETYDGTTIRIYIDGVLDKEQAMSINTVLVVGRIGANVKAPSELFNGAIDEVSIYDRALSENEVAQNFAAEKGLSTGGIA
ncbi:MAG TPA: LamG domain-containing protein, partial [Sedimentisphaerales bacterium]|nr:LamG domain-containing protein [Sedimentisphaerales bacterium]